MLLSSFWWNKDPINSFLYLTWIVYSISVSWCISNDSMKWPSAINYCVGSLLCHSFFMFMYNITANYFNKDYNLNHNGFMSAILKAHLCLFLLFVTNSTYCVQFYLSIYWSQYNTKSKFHQSVLWQCTLCIIILEHHSFP